MSGEAAEAIEKVPAGQTVAEAMAVLRGIFEPQGIQVPTPVQVRPLHMAAIVQTTSLLNLSLCIACSLPFVRSDSDPQLLYCMFCFWVPNGKVPACKGLHVRCAGRMLAHMNLLFLLVVSELEQ